jgi:hypothetical protein
MAKRNRPVDRIIYIMHITEIMCYSLYPTLFLISQKHIAGYHDTCYLINHII